MAGEFFELDMLVVIIALIVLLPDNSHLIPRHSFFDFAEQTTVCIPVIRILLLHQTCSLCLPELVCDRGHNNKTVLASARAHVSNQGDPRTTPDLSFNI